MHRMFIESDKDDDPFEPEVLLKARVQGIWPAHRLAIPAAVESGAAGLFERREIEERPRRPCNASCKPCRGLFDSAPLQAYMQRLAASRGFPDDFRKLRPKLYIVATDLDTAERVVFGAPGWDDVPVSQAVAASSALPGLFPPVKINGRYFVDGALQQTLNASAALKDGVKLLFAVNPLVPYQADIPADRVDTGSLAAGGLLAVLSQTFRSLIHSRMEVGMQRYRHQYPDADIVVIEPRKDDREMFFVNVFSYADRRRLCEHAYQQTRADLLRRAGVLKPILARHGLILDEAVLRDPNRTLMPRSQADGSSLQSALQTLTETLAGLSHC